MTQYKGEWFSNNINDNMIRTMMMIMISDNDINDDGNNNGNEDDNGSFIND